MNTPIRRHLDGATLMSFAAGALAEPLAAAVSAHLSMCAVCRGEVRDMALIGATLLGAVPAPGGRVAAPVVPEAPVFAETAARSPLESGDALPAPIARRYGLAMQDIEWTRLGPGLWQHRLALSAGARGDLVLLKLAPGCRLPLHGHAGDELTVVLTGAFTDASGEYRVGDVQEADAGSEHQPMGDKDEGCICLVAAEGPYILKG